jgi:2-methylcitrate dehydratase PrpD
MKSTTESTPIEKLAANVLETRFENFEQATLENAKNRIIDTVGCLIGGANDPSNLELVNLLKDYGGKEEATILIHGGKVPAGNAAMINSIMARSFDFEPVSPLAEDISTPGHISGTTVMTAISLGEAVGINGRELITALLIGDDVATRVLAASGFGFTAGWDNIGTVNALGATAIAGRLLGLNKLQMRNAFGIVFNQMCGSLQTVWDQTIAFKLLQGLTARNGIFSAQLAKAGWTGPEDALFSQFGYYKMFTEGCQNPEILTKDLGKKYYSDGTFKPYPACRMTHAAIDCALALIQKYDIKAEDIQEAILYVSAGALDHICGHPFKIGSFPHANAAFSFQYTVATALLKKSVKPEHFTEQAIRDPQTNDFIDKIKLVEWQGAELHSAKLKVIMKDGKELIESCDVAKGDPLKNPMPKDEITAKFWINVEFSQTVTKEKAGALLTLLEQLEELDNVTRMVPLLSSLTP